MIRHADMETSVLKEEGYIHRTLNTGGKAHHAGPHGEGPVRRQKGRGQNMAQSLYWGSFGKKLQSQGRVPGSVGF